MIPPSGGAATLKDRTSRVEVTVNGWLLWGLILPGLLVVAGVITLRRRKRGD